MKVAIVGGGISGIMAAYALQEKGMDFTLFEAGGYMGGHAKTLYLPLGDKVSFPIDLGTIMHDPVLMHPTMNEYVRKLRVEIAEFPLDFTFSYPNCTWNTRSNFSYPLRQLSIISKFFLKNIFKSDFSHNRQFIMEVGRFMKEAKEISSNTNFRHMSLGDYLKKENYSSRICDEWLGPQLACWWGVNKEDFLSCSIQVIADSLIKVSSITQYYFRRGWSDFIHHLIVDFTDNIQLNTQVLSIRRPNEKIEIETNKGHTSFDALILATPPNISKQLLVDLTPDENQYLNKYKTTQTTIYCHRDNRWMPQEERWSTVNLIKDKKGEYSTFWVGSLTNTLQDLFITWGEMNEPIDNSKIIEKTSFLRTLPTVDYTFACRDIEKIQGVKKTWHAGAHVHALDADQASSLWHENAFLSGLKAAKAIGELYG